MNPVASVCMLAVPMNPARTSGSMLIVMLADLNGLVLYPVYNQRLATRLTVVAAFCWTDVNANVCVMLAAPGFPARPV